MLDALPAALGRRDAEAVGADHGAALDDAALAHAAAGRDRHARMQQGVGAHVRIGADDAVRPDLRAVADHRAALDHHERSHHRARRDGGLAIDEGGRVDVGRGRRPQALRPPLRQAGEVQVGIVGDDELAAGGRGGDQRGSEHDSPGHAGLEQAAHLGLRNESDRVTARRVQRADARDQVLGVSPQFSAQRRNDLTQAN